MRMLLATIILILTTGLLTAQSKSKSMTEDDFDFDKLLAKEESVRRLFGIGFGIGYPLTNITVSVPYVDIDLGYGGFVGLKPNNFLPYVVMGVDLLFKDEIHKNTMISGGIGIGADWSKGSPEKSNEKTEEEEENEAQQVASLQNRIGVVIRLPLVIEYSFLKNIVIGFKAVATIGTTMLLGSPMSFEGARFNFLGTGFIKIYI
ncbi:DUF3996 domain-containing protein [Borreliella californiensis]|uniref:DUF3996 domain-containing protein n=1 Tax=Borreliella californiensis TaxID=373543 RepID=A0A7W9ZK55_9SPIR|nr:DUF3996 domain-containing protein [Borreliella californiensis]MBB6212966.1 hypothetical protein [Borreliella californiensis]WKC91691.1 DUF3996 domain-containing protein [Borreliella californiensis]WNY70447.1 DUF3996 domain-containing protein [Borreliella californiensis]